MWKSEGDSTEREAASAVRQGVLCGKRRLAAVAVGASLGIAAIVAVYMAWRGAATMHDGEGAVATRHGEARDGGGAIATRHGGAHDGGGVVATRHGGARDGEGGGATMTAEPQKTPEEIEAEERAKDPLYDRHHIVAKRPLLDSPLEQIIHSVFSVEVGDMPPMLPPIPTVDERQLRSAIESITVAKDGDSEEAKEAKRIVNQVKTALKEFLDEGGTVEGFLQHYVNVLDSAFNERNMCRELQMKSMKTDPPEVAREFYNTIQKRLEDKGIKRLTLTRRQKEYLGIEE